MHNFGVPPAWKLKREMTRLRPDKLLPKLFSRSVTLLFGTPYYDFLLSRRRRVCQGKLDLGNPSLNKVAVYLVYPTSGVQQSHVSALEYMIRSGYSPVVVSNHDLSLRDQTELLDRCSLLIMRPNFGYDFGGYRDAILHLAPRIHEFERLVILNDSCWFPVPRHVDWLYAAEQLEKDLVGTFQVGYKVNRIRARAGNRNRQFYPSFALMFSRRVLGDPDFLRYWKRLSLSNNKFTMVKRGELGCNRLVIDKGYSHGATCDWSQLSSGLGNCSSAELLYILENFIPQNAELNHELRLEKSTLISEFADDRDWKRNAVSFLLAPVSKIGLPVCAAFELERTAFGFLKKRPIRLLQQDGNDRETADVIARFGPNCDFDLSAEISRL